MQFISILIAVLLVVSSIAHNDEKSTQLRSANNRNEGAEKNSYSSIERKKPSGKGKGKGKGVENSSKGGSKRGKSRRGSSKGSSKGNRKGSSKGGSKRGSSKGGSKGSSKGGSKGFKSKEEQGLRNDNNTTEMETPPTPAPTTLTRQVQLRRVLRAAGANVSFFLNQDDDDDDLDGNDDNDRPTAQKQAFQWLAYADNYTGYDLDLAEDAALKQNLTNLDLKTIVRRYALAVFYYSTGGPQWKQSFQFLTSTSVCDWSDSFRTGTGCIVEYPGLPVAVSFDGNGLNGTLPREIQLLQELRGLAVRNNHLRGTLPTELGSMKDLQIISASDNDLTGPIPTQLGELEKLQSVFLQRNEMTGTIPPFFWFLSSMEILRLESNNFVGSFGPLEETQCGTPYAFEQLSMDCFLDGESERAEVTCPCCTLCCEDGEEQSVCYLQDSGNE